MGRYSSRIFSIILLFFIPIHLQGQSDTIFWFAAPDVDASYGDSPIYLRISSLDQPSTVYITLPANPSISYTLNLDANSTNSINLTSVKSFLETPANTTANNGIKIISTTKISVYYDVVGTSGTGRIQNTEIFILKGRYALGQKFYAPIQTTLTNATNENGYSGFDIVASEDNTTVTITPTAALYGGHAAGIPFNINLNTGQTYSASALVMSGAGHPGGSLITATKPVAVTVKDDCLLWSIGSCRDLTGDQIVPVDYIGTDYIVLKGFLNGNDQAVIFGTEPNTQIFVKGVLNSTINQGSIMPINITDNATYINTSKPVYIMHLSGFGCQLGSPILPSIECSGYNQIGFTRSINYPFFLNIMTKTGTQDGFTLNGNAGLINASSFNVVPNKPDWVYAQLQFDESQIAVNTGNIIKNSKGNFQMGLLNGSSASGSACYGYFSGFNTYSPKMTIQNTCLNDVTLFSLSDESMLRTITWDFGDNASGPQNVSTLKNPTHVFTGPGTYSVKANIIYECGSKELIKNVMIMADFVPNLPDTITTCGENVVLDPKVANSQGFTYKWSTNESSPVITTSLFGVYWVDITNQAGCTKRDITHINYILEDWKINNKAEFCVNGSVKLDASWPVCKWSTGETTQYITVSSAGTYSVQVTKNNCSKVGQIEVSERKLPEFNINDSLIKCSANGTSIKLEHDPAKVYYYLWSTGATTQNIFVTKSGKYFAEVRDEINCKRSDSIDVIFYSVPEISLGEDKTICPGESAKFYALKGTGPFTWSNGLTEDTIIVKKEGKYWVTVKNPQCQNSDTIELKLHTLPKVSFGPDTFFCKGDTKLINPGTYINYKWSTNETSQTITVTTPGTYYVDVTDKNSCKNRGYVIMSQWEPPEITRIDTIPDSQITIYASGGKEPYRYSIFENIFQPENIFNSVEPGNYTVIVIDKNECRTAKNLGVNDDQLFIPKFFTPNNDGINDTWEIIGLNSYPYADIKIFNRFGKLVKSYKGADLAWDGYYQNHIVPADDYWYIIDLKRKWKPFTGHVTIIK